MTTNVARCPRCGVQGAGDGGACPGCLLRAALSPPVEDSELTGALPFGPYVLVKQIARGGMGIVYAAYEARADRRVALKMLLSGALADAAELERFREEVKNAARLQHDHIVPIFDHGEIDGCPYFTMPLMADTLETRLPSLRADRRKACTLVAIIARAVDFGHQHGVVHRDLKPSNVLFSGDTPRVADFGTAKNLNRQTLTATGTMVGTPGYMAPEQVRGEAPRVTARADIYSLGAILYEILTGRPPFTADTVERTLNQVLSDAEPVRPRAIDPSIDRDLETICLTCLEKDPARRYSSAAALAEDLELYLAGKPIVARPVGWAGRTLRWSRRQPAAAATGVSTLVFLAAAAWLALGVAGTQAEELRSEVLAADRYAARMAAGAVRFQLRAFADRVRAAASGPALVERLERREYAAVADAGFPEGLEPPGAVDHFDSWLFDDALSVEQVHWPEQVTLGKTYAFRDYFRGAMELGARGERGVHVSRAFDTEADGRVKFFFSAPVFAADGTVLGVLAASVPADATLGKTAIGDLGAAGGLATGAIISPRDRSRSEADGPLPRDFLYLVHDGLKTGTRIQFTDGDKRGLREVYRVAQRCWAPGQGIPEPECVVIDRDFRDSVPGFDRERWLAALAPVAGTPFAVVVQTRDAAALQSASTLAARVARFGVPLLLGCGALGVLLFFALRRRV